MARVPLSKGKERAKAKIKAGQKANASKPSNFSMSDFKVRYASGKPVVTAAPKKAAAPVKKAETKKPVTVINAKGKTIYDPKARTITTYDKKGKTVVDNKIGSSTRGTTTYNKKGSIRKTKGDAYFYDIKNKKGRITSDEPTGQKGFSVAFNKKGTQLYDIKNDYKTIRDSKGERDVPVKTKPVTKKPEVKKPAAKPNNKDLINKMTRTGQAYYLDTKSGKVEKNPDVKNTIKKVAEDSKNKQAKIVKSKIESLKRPEIRKKVIKPEVVVKPKKNNEPTVSQLWQQKTGTSWSEAKKQGLTDGSASANMALMKKLKSGEISKSSLSKPKTEATPTPVTTTPTPTPTPKPTPYAGSGIGAMERSEREFEEQGFRRGGSVRKMRKSVIVKRRK
jgi:hypothetical protein